MATYTLNGTFMECTGTDITSAGIKTAVDANPACGTAYADTGGTKDVYIFNAQLRIGTAISTGLNSIWTCSNQSVSINGTHLDVYGTIRQGSSDAGFSKDGGNFTFIQQQCQTDGSCLRLAAVSLGAVVYIAIRESAH